ncbi:MAG: VOC family protein [Deltaproteobacteria bacterium]|nr:VOC family protein [Deltaproteobacteria bacterium]
MIINGTHHVALICSDYERAKHFYVNILGLQILHETFRAERDSFKLDLGMPDGSRLELFTFPSSPPRASYPEACGLRHLAFKVADLEEALTVVRGHGVAVQEIRIDGITGKRFAFFEDPDGLPIEFYEET